MPFNRTSLELKLVHNLIHTLQRRRTFNRTSLELKLDTRSYASHSGYPPFNRTSLELKPLTSETHEKRPA